MECRLHGDYLKSWGDGRGGMMAYPVWIKSIWEDKVLAKILRALSQQRGDVQPNGIVHDIIDPSLNAQLLSQEEHKQVKDEKKREDYVSGYRSAFDELNHWREQQHEETMDRRGAFRWVPVEVEVDDWYGWGLPARLLGQVPGLPERMACTESIYSHLEDILQEALPLLAKIDLRSEAYQSWGGNTPERLLEEHHLPQVLQVVIKAQEYILPPHSTFTGRWHTEGFSEHISAAAVYYVDISEETEGGYLSFRPPSTPSESYFSESDDEDGNNEDNDDEDEDANQIESDDENANNEDDEDEDANPEHWTHFIKDVKVVAGTLVVFHNSVPHRFRSIRNDTNEPQRRLFCNFFIVDPDNPLPITTSNTAGSDLIRRALLHAGIHDAPLQNLILSFVCGYANADWLHRKVLRDQARTAMSKDRPHWYTYQFSENHGSLLYHNDGRLFDYGRFWFSDAYSVGRYEHSNCNTSALGSNL